MIHHTCDRCKQEIDPKCDLRYVVRIEVEAALDPYEDDFGSGIDHLDELSEVLETADDFCNSSLGDDLYQRKRYDLCGSCYRQYMKNPLAREFNVPFGFSQN